MTPIWIIEENPHLKSVHIVCFSTALYTYSASWILLVYNPYNVRTVNYTWCLEWREKRKEYNLGCEAVRPLMRQTITLTSAEREESRSSACVYSINPGCDYFFLLFNDLTTLEVTWTRTNESALRANLRATCESSIKRELIRDFGAKTTCITCDL
jgi:hypothetical protein